MKNLYLIPLVILMNSCTAYKKVEGGNFVNGIQYEITDRTGHKSKITVLEVRQDSLRIQVDGAESTIVKADISVVKEKKFSAIKTAGAGLIYVAAGAGLILLSILKMSGW